MRTYGKRGIPAHPESAGRAPTIARTSLCKRTARGRDDIPLPCISRYWGAPECDTILISASLDEGSAFGRRPTRSSLHVGQSLRRSWRPMGQLRVDALDYARMIVY